MEFTLIGIFFSSWQDLLRIFIVTITGYLSMIIFLRLSGKRTLSKMNAFDFIITIALGSALSTVALDKNVVLAEGALVFFLLIFMQYLMTWGSVRVKHLKQLVTGEPSLLLYKGQVIEQMVKKERITREEINLAARKKGITNLEEVDAMVLETSGKITVIPKWPSENNGTLKDVNNTSHSP